MAVHDVSFSKDCVCSTQSVVARTVLFEVDTVLPAHSQYLGGLCWWKTVSISEDCVGGIQSVNLFHTHINKV